MTDWGDPNLPPGVTQDQLDMDYGDICACGHRDHEHYDDEDVENNPDLKVGVCDITGCNCEEYQVETKLGWLHPINIHNKESNHPITLSIFSDFKIIQFFS